LLRLRSAFRTTFAAVCRDIEPFAAEGFLALAMVNGRQRMVLWGGNRKLLGTSLDAVCLPAPQQAAAGLGPASSVMAVGEILLARAALASCRELSGIGI
jgi:delta1-piperideine-2-carboxylate reductase